MITNFSSSESISQEPLKRHISPTGSTDGSHILSLSSEAKVTSVSHLYVFYLSVGLNASYIVIVILIGDLGDKPKRKFYGLMTMCSYVTLTRRYLRWLVLGQLSTS